MGEESRSSARTHSMQTPYLYYTDRRKMENCQVDKNKSLTISTAKTADITNTEHLFSWKHYIENK